jgi:hypothetical protein
MANKPKITQESKEFKPTQVEVSVERWRLVKALAAIEGKPVYRLVDEALVALLKSHATTTTTKV